MSDYNDFIEDVFLPCAIGVILLCTSICAVMGTLIAVSTFFAWFFG